jgi:transcription initiation factor IIE alpha subunit
MSDTLPYQRHSETSAAAADQAAGRAPTDRERVLLVIRSEKERGLIDEEIERLLNMNPSTVRPRRGELVKLGLVCNSGRTRDTRSGAKATVWIATTSGVQLALDLRERRRKG